MSELSRKNDNELRKELFEKRRLLREFRFGAAGSRVRNTRDGRHLRRDIARILTEVRRRHIVGKVEEVPKTIPSEADIKQ